MDKMTELFDALLVHSYQYPNTLWRLIFRPSSVLGDEPRVEPCSPGITFFYTACAGYFILISTESSTVTKFPKWLSGEVLLVLMILYFAILVNLQRIAIVRIIRAEKEPVDQVKLLFYPLCILLLGTAMAFPLIRARHQRFWIMPVHVLYIAVLFNTIRYGLQSSTKRALFGAATAYIVFVLVSVGISLGVLLAS